MIFKELQEKYPDWVWMSIVGSHNYGTATQNSDIDVKIAYLPTFEEFYYNSFKHIDKSGPGRKIDYTLHPVHEFLKHALKGNMNFWEVFYSPSLVVNPKYFKGGIIEICKSIVNMNYVANFNAMRGMAVQKAHQFEKEMNNNQLSCWKHGQHSLRMLDTLKWYMETGNIVLNMFNVINPIWSEMREDVRLTEKASLEFFDKYNDFLSKIDSLEDEIIFGENEKKRIKELTNLVHSTIMEKVLKNS